MSTTTSILNNITPATVVIAVVLAAAVALFVVFLFQYLKSLIKEPKNLLIGMAVSLIIAVLALIVLLIPRNETALFAPGIGLGESASYYSDPQSGAVTVRVSEKSIWLGNVLCTDVQDLSERLKTLDLSELTVTLTDDYASAETYHQTEEALSALGLTWKTESLS